MKFKVQMKDPDTLNDAIREAVKDSVNEMDLPEGERAAIADVRAETCHEVARPFFQYGEYLTVEIDTDAKTCVVVAYK